jgi:hypothetical protein
MTWDGPARDILYVFIEPTPDWGATYHNEVVSILRELDERDEATGKIVGVEILDFLRYDRWDDLPKLDLLWQLPGQQPLPLDELLKREQQRLRREALAATP